MAKTDDASREKTIERLAGCGDHETGFDKNCAFLSWESSYRWPSLGRWSFQTVGPNLDYCPNHAA